MIQRIHPLTELRKNPFVLAPMAGITDHSFRTFMRKRGAGVVISELVSATGLEYQSVRTQSLTSFEECQRPVGIQIFGENPEHLSRAAAWIEEKGADFIDLNFGCPVPKVVKKGAGSAMLKDLPAMKEVLRATVSAVKIPVTIKIRTGWDANSRNAQDVVALAADEGITWVAIHGRTRAQGYEGLADWDYIGNIKAKAKIPILGNGDVVSSFKAVEKLKTYGLDGIMIGRGALKNPYIFADCLSLLESGQLADLDRDYEQLFFQLYKELVAHCDDRLIQIQLKKFAAWFATGYAGAAQLRKSIFQSQSTEEVMSTAICFFRNLKLSHQENLNNEGFLMGGHG